MPTIRDAGEVDAQGILTILNDTILTTTTCNACWGRAA